MCCQNKAVRQQQRAARRVAKFNARAAYYGYQLQPSDHPNNQIVLAETPMNVHHHTRRGCCGRERRGGPITALFNGVVAIVNAVQDNREKKRSAIERDVLPSMRSQMGGLQDEKVRVAELERSSEDLTRNETEDLEIRDEQLPKYEEVQKL
ncbi:hypothetical protein BDZ85DRAFT_260529 [Elsinoe ampelina]|uniref:Uncharacterized protein n=1 Tax=Elsinoe ampelina TaxID=302913 RepID=A0A6A6GEQ3_9PEZI|nr:hypothetical protein BDZ85DRAFT_260529 [Elsinoe ampelina]